MLQRFASIPTGFVLIIASVACPSWAAPKSKAKADNPQDRIDILANLTVSGGPVTRVTMTQHYSRSYLYVEHASKTLTLIDVTDARHPAVLANLELPVNEAGSILTAAGETALVSSDTAQPATAARSAAPRTMTIVNFADPVHPQTVKQFANVTCTAMDERRGLIFVANDEGFWILHRNPAEDPAVQEEYTRQVLYAH